MLSLLQIWLMIVAVNLLNVVIKGHSAIDTASAGIYFSAITLLIVHFLGKKGGA